MKLQFLAGFAFAVLALAGVWAYASWDQSRTGNLADQGSISHEVATNTPPNTPPQGDGKKSPTSETITGTIECLPHKGDGPHTMECAIGLKGDDGKHYALTTFNYPSDADVGDHVKLVGVTVNTDDFHAKYDIVGTFQVATVEKI